MNPWIRTILVAICYAVSFYGAWNINFENPWFSIAIIFSGIGFAYFIDRQQTKYSWTLYGVIFGGATFVLILANYLFETREQRLNYLPEGFVIAWIVLWHGISHSFRLVKIAITPS